MPEPPGERSLRTLAQRHEATEQAIRELVERAPGGDRRALLLTALELLIVLRTLDARKPVVAAYLAEHPFGATEAVDDLAGALHKRLDDGIRRAQSGTRRAFRHVTDQNLEEMSLEATTAHDGVDGSHWGLSRWAGMQTATVGRQATSKGLADSIGERGAFVVQGGSKCALCRGLADGVKVVGEDRMPPFHPSCDCVAVRV
jgi:hypothetical protein